MVSAPDLDELERLARAATPGPWRESGRYVDAPDNPDFSPIECHRDIAANVAFVAAANPAAMLELIAEVRRLRATVERARNAVDNADAAVGLSVGDVIEAVADALEGS